MTIKSSRPAANRAAKVIGEIPASVTGPTDNAHRLPVAPTPTWPVRLHEAIEREADVAYHQGYADGVADARVAFAEQIERAIDPGPDVNPHARMAVLNRTAKNVVRALVEQLDRESKPPAPGLARVDYTGGPVPWDTQDRLESAA